MGWSKIQVEGGSETEERKYANFRTSLAHGERLEGDLLIPTRVESMISDDDFPCVMAYLGESLSKNNNIYFNCKILNRKCEDVLFTANKWRKYDEEMLARLCTPVSLSTFPKGTLLVCTNLETDVLDGNEFAIADYEWGGDEDETKIGKVFIPLRKVKKSLTNKSYFIIRYNGGAVTKRGFNYFDFDLVSNVEELNSKVKRKLDLE